MLPQDEGQPFPPYDFPRECMWRSARLAQGRGGLESLKTGRPPGKLAPSSSLPPGMPQLFPALQAPIRLLASDAPSESPHFLISSTSPRGGSVEGGPADPPAGQHQGARASAPARTWLQVLSRGRAESPRPPRGPCGDLTVRTACAGSQCRDSQPRVSIPRGPLQGFSFWPA